MCVYSEDQLFSLLAVITFSNFIYFFTQNIVKYEEKQFLRFFISTTFFAIFKIRK